MSEWTNQSLEFDEVSYETWRKQVEQELKGENFERKLVTTTLDGLKIQPLYPAGTEDTRVPRTLGRSAGGWKVAQWYDVDNVEAAREAIADDVRHGVEAIRLSASTEFPETAYDLARVLEGIDAIDNIRVFLPTTRDATGAFAMAGAWTSRNRVSFEHCAISLGFDPVSVSAQLGEVPTLDWGADEKLGIAALLQVAGEKALLRIFRASGLWLAERGAGTVTELAAALSSAIECLKLGAAADMDLAAIARCLEFEISVGREFFVEVAKFRALRKLWAQVLAQCGLQENRRPPAMILAVTPQRDFAMRDVWVNLLRSSTATVAAGLGNVDYLVVRPFRLDVTDPMARRIARNTQLVAREESHLGAYSDPMAGSAYIESLTEQIAERVWAEVQDLESAGGLRKAIASGKLQKAVASQSDARLAAIRTRKFPLLGVSEFAQVGDVPELPRQHSVASRSENTAVQSTIFPQDALERELRLAWTRDSKPAARLAAALAAAVAGATRRTVASVVCPQPARSPLEIEFVAARRDAEVFEYLWRRSHQLNSNRNPAPRILVWRVSEESGLEQRLAWLRLALAAGGIVAEESDAADRANAVIICGTEASYAELGSFIRLAREKSARVFVAGRPLETLPAGDAPDGWIYVGCDLVSVLETLLVSMEVES